MSNMPLGIIFPRRVLYIYAVFIAGIIFMSIAWFCLTSFFNAIEQAGISVANNLGTRTATYDLEDAFFSNIFQYFLVLMILGMAYWMYIYAQRKGAGM